MLLVDIFSGNESSFFSAIHVLNKDLNMILLSTIKEDNGSINS